MWYLEERSNQLRLNGCSLLLAKGLRAVVTFFSPVFFPLYRAGVILSCYHTCEELGVEGSQFPSFQGYHVMLCPTVHGSRRLIRRRQ